MLKKILIANRGEIAVRIIRAAKELGVRTVAVYSEADADSLHTRFADESVCIGPPQARESYLNIPRIISAAEVTGAEAIHPGYGFLAENAEFAEICESCKIIFIGPKPSQIKAMGDKVRAKKTMEKAGVPVIPGSKGEVSSLEDAQKIAEEFTLPVILKAAAGGGGKGMRVVGSKDELESGFRLAQAEARAAFNDGRLYIEKYIARPRHIEIQILGDNHGNVVSLGERECSIQRRHQKLIEETPSPVVDDALREKLGKAAVAGAREIGYSSAGTIEFLMDEKGDFYFMEMNARIQVEHPVTEMVSGIDIVKEQIRIAGGEPLSFEQKDVRLVGHAIECRINAEDPERDFVPTPGKINFLHLPGGPGIRVDTHVYAGYLIPPYYDSIIAKVIGYDKTRLDTIKRVKRALEEIYIDGIKTTVSFHLMVMQNQDFIEGRFSTAFVDDLLKKNGAAKDGGIKETE